MDEAKIRFRKVLEPLLQPSALPPVRKLPLHTFMNSKDAAQLDADLMGSEGYTLEQLMELAGLSCAEAIYKMYPRESFREICILCGPGNNGGDGLVAARHLRLFDYDVTVVYPSHDKDQRYRALLTQCRAHGVIIVGGFYDSIQARTSLVVDAIFGFSFNASKPVREPYATMIQQLIAIQNHVPVVAIDVPSGWDVDATTLPQDPFPGQPLRLAVPAYTAILSQLSYMPDMLISLSAPKRCAKLFLGRFHMLGGRFIPKRIAQRYNLKLPRFAKTEQSILIDAPQHHEVLARRSRPQSDIGSDYGLRPLPSYFAHRSHWPVDSILAPLLEPSNAYLDRERPPPHPVRTLSMATPPGGIGASEAGPDEQSKHADASSSGPIAPNHYASLDFEHHSTSDDVSAYNVLNVDDPEAIDIRLSTEPATSANTSTSRPSWPEWNSLTDQARGGLSDAKDPQVNRKTQNQDRPKSKRRDSTGAGMYAHIFDDNEYTCDSDSDEQAETHSPTSNAEDHYSALPASTLEESVSQSAHVHPEPQSQPQSLPPSHSTQITPTQLGMQTSSVGSGYTSGVCSSYDRRLPSPDNQTAAASVYPPTTNKSSSWLQDMMKNRLASNKETSLETQSVPSAPIQPKSPSQLQSSTQPDIGALFSTPGTSTRNVSTFATTDSTPVQTASKSQLDFPDWLATSTGLVPGSIFASPPPTTKAAESPNNAATATATQSPRHSVEHAVSPRASQRPPQPSTSPSAASTKLSSSSSNVITLQIPESETTYGVRTPPASPCNGPNNLTTRSLPRGSISNTALIPNRASDRSPESVTSTGTSATSGSSGAAGACGSSSYGASVYDLQNGIAAQPYYHPDADRVVACTRLVEAGGVGRYLFRPGREPSDPHKYILSYLAPNEKCSATSVSPGTSPFILMNTYIWYWPSEGFTRSAERGKSRLYTSIRHIVTMCMSQYIQGEPVAVMRPTAGTK